MRLEPLRSYFQDANRFIALFIQSNQAYQAYQAKRVRKVMFSMPDRYL